MPRKSNLDVRQRSELVMQLIRKEESAVCIALRGVISEQTLYRWRDEFIRGGQEALMVVIQSPQRRDLERKSAQLAERDQVIGELTVANRFKKGLGKLRLAGELKLLIVPR